jgi:hypothetical protein
MRLFSVGGTGFLPGDLACRSKSNRVLIERLLMQCLKVSHRILLCGAIAQGLFRLR